MSRVLVTGASGFVGSHVARALTEAGHEVVGAVRRPGGLPRGVAETVVGDVGPGTDWRTALRGVDAVVHLAAHVHRLGAEPPAEFRRVNVEGTRALAEASARAGVRRLVLMSSVAVVSGRAAAGERPFREDDPCRPEEPYGVSKLEAEAVLRETGEREGLETVVLRPPMVYGPRVPANFLRLLRLVERGLPLPLGGVRNRRSMLYVANLADAVRVVLHHPAAAGGTYFLADDEALATPELVRRLAAGLGRPARIVPVPVPLLRAVFAAMGRGDDLDRLTRSFLVDASRARRELGWSPRVGVDEGLAETVRWYRDSAREAAA